METEETKTPDNGQLSDKIKNFVPFSGNSNQYVEGNNPSTEPVLGSSESILGKRTLEK